MFKKIETTEIVKTEVIIEYDRFLKAALAYHQDGFQVIPTNPQSKRPLLGVMLNDYKDGPLVSKEQIEKWWTPPTSETTKTDQAALLAEKPPGIGIMCGVLHESTRLVLVADIDPTQEHNWKEVQAALNGGPASGGAWPPTIEVTSSPGHVSLWYKLPNNWQKPVRAFELKAPGDLGKIHFRGYGQYQIVGPSLHPDGYRYRGTPKYDDLATTPPWVLDLLQKNNQENPQEETQETATTKNPDGASGSQTTELIIKAVWPLLPPRAHALLQGKAVVSDRSLASAELAHLCVEAGLTDPETIAHLVMSAPCHKNKYARRIGGHNAWADASVCAAKALGKRELIWATRPHGQITGPTVSSQLEFPVNSAVGICAEIAQMFAECMEAPFSFWYMSALTCLGVAVSGTITLDTELAPQPRLYCTLIGPSADGRKSTALNMSVKFFREALEPLAREAVGEVLHVEHGLGSGEGLAETIMQLRNDGEPARCLIALDELKMLVQKARIENSSLLPMLCSLYSLNFYSNATRRTRIKLSNAHLGLLGACTIETYDTMWTPEFLDMGFLNRLFVVPDTPSKLIAIPTPIPQEKRWELQKKFMELVEDIHKRALQKGGSWNSHSPCPGQGHGVAFDNPDLDHLDAISNYGLESANTISNSGPNPTSNSVPNSTINSKMPMPRRRIYPLGSEPLRMAIEPAAAALWRQWYEEDRPRSIHTRRLDDIGMRLMVLLSMSKGEFETVSLCTMEQALALLRWQFTVRKAYDPINADGSVAEAELRILRALFKHGKSTDSLLRREIHANRTGIRIFTWGVANLEEAGLVQVKRKGKEIVTVELTEKGAQEAQST